MQKHIYILLLILSSYSFAQKTSKITTKGDGELKLSSLKIDVSITGNFATTTYDMKFYNGLDRVLEGELVFPLAEGQSVSKFAMDVNGKLRAAVVVEKELARVAYESTIRQKIDPGLLVKTQGNNYKARVYPIPSKGYKHIIISYEQELHTVNNKQHYLLPLHITEKLDIFSLNIMAYGLENKPKLKNNAYNSLQFKKDANGIYIAKFVFKNHKPSTGLSIETTSNTATDQLITYKNYFHFYKTLQPNTRLKVKPKKITLLWDCSYSLRNRALKKELQLLGQYFNYLENVTVNLISFSDKTHLNKTYKITNSNWKQLKKQLQNTIYDGGTVYPPIDKLKNETLLFSDGLINLGNLTRNSKKPIYTINSTVTADHELLTQIATNSGGNYINLNSKKNSDALVLLKQETFQFLGVKHDENIKEVYPNSRKNVSADFTITGEFEKITSLELLFGYQGKVTERITVPIKKNKGTKTIKRLWAKQKLSHLNLSKKENKDAIIKHGIAHQLISDYTSMLILDRVEDYAQHNITPPQELLQAYNKLLKDREEEIADLKEELDYRREDLFQEYQDLLSWYADTFPKKIEPKNNNVEIRSTITTPTNNSTAVNNENITTLDNNKRIVSGTIKDYDGTPLPGTNILIQGTGRGTQSDFDGNFSINAEENDVLVFSYLGYQNNSFVVNSSNSSINIPLEEDSSALEEVVITSMGTQREVSSLSYAVTTVSSNLLQGKAGGVTITNTEAPITLRGSTTITTANQPLYVLDGLVQTNNPIDTLKPEEIESIETLSSENGAKLYGDKAINGVLIITSKEGAEENSDKIDALNKKIADQIDLKSWNPNTPYLKVLEKEITVRAAYKKYIAIRPSYENSPSFYLDIADFFAQKGDHKIAITVLSNLMELKLDDYELMKALAYKLEYFKQYNLAIIVYKKVLELRPEEPQSYRDLALAYEQAGEYQKSFNLLYKIYNGELLQKDMDERYEGIEHIAFVEVSRLANKYKKKLKLSAFQKKEFSPFPVDIRIVIDWNHNDTDIDLWVFDPNGEKAYYSHPNTTIGGHVSNDFTEGYGPEEYLLKKAIKGKYKVMINYYADNVQKISGPTILKATLFTNYGRKNEKKETITLRLAKQDGEITVGTLTY